MMNDIPVVHSFGASLRLFKFAPGKFVGLTMLMLTAGCSILPERPPAPAMHDFGPATTGQAPVPWPMVVVESPDWLQDDRIHYRRLYADPTRVDSYARSRWVAPLPELLKARLSESGSGRGYRLHIRLLDFEQVFDHPDSARVVVQFRAQAQEAGGQPVGERLFRLSRPAATPDAAGAVAAFADSMAQAVAQLHGWAAQLPQSLTGEQDE